MISILICTNNIYSRDVYEGINAYFAGKSHAAKIVLNTNDPSLLLDYLQDTSSENVYLAILSEFDDNYDVAISIRASLKNSYIVFVSKNKPFLELMTNRNIMLSGFVTYPFLDETFTQILDNVINFYLSLNINKNTHLEIETGANKYFVPFKDIMYIAAETKKTKYVTLNKTYYNRVPLKVIINNLDSRFVKIHNSFIVNVQQIKEINYADNTVIMKDYVVLEEKVVKGQYKNTSMTVEKTIHEDGLAISRAHKSDLKENLKELRLQYERGD